jgi:tetratricopeptide (TPR) repeat protein
MASVEELTRQAQAAEDEDRFEETQRLLDDALAQVPDHRDALMARARVARLQHRFGEAAEFARRAAQGSGDGREELLELANDLRRDYQCNASLPIFDRLLERDAGDVEARAGYGLLLLELDQPQLALEIFRALAGEQPDEEDHRVGLAGALVKLGRHREALAELEAILAASPDYVRAQLWAVEACFGLHHYRRAAQHLAAAYKTDDTWPLVHYWAARMATLAGKLELREKEASEALRLQRTLYEAEIQLAYIWWRRGKLDDTFQLLRHAHEVAPWSGGAEAALVEFMLEEGRGEPDLAELEERAQRLPYSRLPYHLGHIHQHVTGDLEASQRLLSLAVETMPDDVDARLALGQTLLLRDEWEAALQAYLRAADLSPQEERAWRGLGIAQQNGGHTEAAAKSYRQALSLDPKDAESHHGLGMVLDDLGQREAALMHLRRAVELDGSDEEYRRSLAEVLARS